MTQALWRSILKRHNERHNVFLFLFAEAVFERRHLCGAGIDDVEYLVVGGFASVRQFAVFNSLQARTYSYFLAVGIVAVVAVLSEDNFAAVNIATRGISVRLVLQRETGGTPQQQHAEDGPLTHPFILCGHGERGVLHSPV